MSDLISRAEAIDIIMSLIEEPEDDFNEAVRCSAKMVMDLPSTQPEQRWTRLMTYLADLQLACSPNCGANGCGDEKLYAFVTGLINGLQGWEKETFEDVINEEPSAEPEKIRCKDCKYKYVDGDNVKFNLCALNHNKVQSDDWYCADAEREEHG